MGAAFLTAFGLVAAYWTAIAVWKAQKEIELRFDTAGKMQALFQISQRHAIELGSHLSILRGASEESASFATSEEKALRLSYVNARAEAFDEHVRDCMNRG